jgi:hypothetical protein
MAPVYHRLLDLAHVEFTSVQEFNEALADVKKQQLARGGRFSSCEVTLPSSLLDGRNDLLGYFDYGNAS